MGKFLNENAENQISWRVECWWERKVDTPLKVGEQGLFISWTEIAFLERYFQKELSLLVI